MILWRYNKFQQVHAGFYPTVWTYWKQTLYTVQSMKQKWDNKQEIDLKRLFQVATRERPGEDLKHHCCVCYITKQLNILRDDSFPDVTPVQKPAPVFSGRFEGTRRDVEACVLRPCTDLVLCLATVNLPTWPAFFKKRKERGPLCPVQFLKPLIWWMHSEQSLSSHHTAENSY